jgi:hypothetical protein
MAAAANVENEMDKYRSHSPCFTFVPNALATSPSPCNIFPAQQQYRFCDHLIDFTSTLYLPPTNYLTCSGLVSHHKYGNTQLNTTTNNGTLPTDLVSTLRSHLCSSLNAPRPSQARSLATFTDSTNNA